MVRISIRDRYPCQHFSSARIEQSLLPELVFKKSGCHFVATAYLLNGQPAGCPYTWCFYRSFRNNQTRRSLS
jgi:hypothetical protein